MNVTTPHNPKGWQEQLQLFTESINMTRVYQRYGSNSIASLEAELSDLSAYETIAFDCGMAALTTAIHYTKVKFGEVIFVNTLYYDSAREIFKDMMACGHTVIFFTIEDDYIALVKEYKPRLIFTETVSNCSNTGTMRMINLRAILETTETYASDENPVSIIMNNTLPSVFPFDPLEYLWTSKKVELICVESGAKHWAKDKAMLGILYSRNKKTITEIRTVGTNLCTQIQDAAIKDIPGREGINMGDINTHTDNCLELARGIFNSPLVAAVYHPNLPDHPDEELASSISQHGITTVFYVKMEAGVDSFEVARKIHKASDRKTMFSGSFGHAETRILS